MRPMRRSDTEVEIKLPFDSPAAARARLEESGASIVEPRQFEGNVLFDRDTGELSSGRKLLRLRRTGPRALLTFKAPLDDDPRYKIRREIETTVEDPDALERILEELGYAPSYRYEKYRTVYEIGGLVACLDETPIGCYVELEGSPGTIEAVAKKLGFSSEHYIVDSYRELHEASAARRGVEPGNLVFEQAES